MIVKKKMARRGREGHPGPGEACGLGLLMGRA